MKKIWRIVAGLVVAAGVVTGATMALRASLEKRGEEVPTVRVRRGTVEMKVYARGELRPARTQILVAPPIGGQLQIVKILKTGDRVRKGDAVAEFDPSDQEYSLEQATSQLLEAEQQIAKARADSAVQAAQDEVSLLQARFAVRRAELDVARSELVSAIDARKYALALQEARRRLAQLELDVKSRRASEQASLRVLEERRNENRLRMMQARMNIENMSLKAPMDGMVSIKEARLDFYFSGMVVPEWREGDVVWPGSPVAEILEIGQMEILAKVSENDRGTINPGQNVEVQVDAMPGRQYTAKVKNVAGMAARGGWWGSSAAERKFDAVFELTSNGPDLKPGSSAQVIIVGDQAQNALILPRQAFFDKDGKPVVFLRVGERFEAREVKILKRTESQVAIEGLKEGDEVALVHPEARRKGPAKTSGPITPTGGG